MKNLKDIAINPFMNSQESFFKPKRSAYNVLPGIGAQNGSKYGYIKTFAGATVGEYTGLQITQPASPVSGALVAPYSTANQYLIVGLSTASPYIKATLYDSAKRSVTALTISGALAASAVNPMKCSLVWMSTYSAWYLKSGGEQKVYPLTISGTTLTVGTAIDISGTFATTANVQMTGDGTTGLFFFDTAAALFKKYTLSGVSAGSFGSALTNPTAGYYNTDAQYMTLKYSNGHIYFLSPSVAQGFLYTFQDYNISNNTWTDKTIPEPLRGALAWSTVMIVDPADNTYIYFASGYANYNNAANDEPNVYRWLSASDTWEFYGITGAQDIAASNYTSTPSQWSGSNIYGEGSSIRTGFYSYANEDIGWLANLATQSTCISIYNVGRKWGRWKLVDYTGSGYFNGIAAPIISNYPGSTTSTSIVANAPLTLFVTIDGGAERMIHVPFGPAQNMLEKLNVGFSSSIKIEVVGGGGCASSAGYVGRVKLYAFLNVTS